MQAFGGFAFILGFGPSFLVGLAFWAFISFILAFWAFISVHFGHLALYLLAWGVQRPILCMRGVQGPGGFDVLFYDVRTVFRCPSSFVKA